MVKVLRPFVHRHARAEQAHADQGSRALRAPHSSAGPLADSCCASLQQPLPCSQARHRLQGCLLALQLPPSAERMV